ncbi:hypothetical protein DRJ22_04955 [Candidatus Woesearchaeota archaeon]|nr:MAG: hypothetical protein DRJ22_04955 [Candidatus Woesearchaeota archaeon]
MKKVNFDELKSIQRKVAKEVLTDDTIKPENIKLVAGFDVAYAKDKAVCACAVMDIKEMKVVERKHIVTKIPMNYVPGFLAFREGPPIAQLFYELEADPDVLLIDGHGIAHPQKCGTASFVGVEVAKPTIGIAKGLLFGEVKDDKIMNGEEIIGALVKTKEHAKPLYISAGHMISLETAIDLVKKLVVPPHKMPEPLHVAHRIADKTAQELKK